MFFPAPTKLLSLDLRPLKIVHIDLDGQVLWFQKDALWFGHKLPMQLSEIEIYVLFDIHVWMRVDIMTDYRIQKDLKHTCGLNCMVLRTSSTSCPLSFFSIMATRKRRSDMAMMKIFIYSERKMKWLKWLVIQIFYYMDMLLPCKNDKNRQMKNYLLLPK